MDHGTSDEKLNLNIAKRSKPADTNERIENDHSSDEDLTCLPAKICYASGFVLICIIVAVVLYYFLS